MKVLQINSTCGYGSTGRIATDIYKILEEQGHECVIAYGRGNAPLGTKVIKVGSDIDNYLHVAKTRILDKHGFGSTKSTKELLKKITEYDPDIIHLHNIHGYYVNIEMLFNYLKKSGKPVIWTLHDCWAFTGHCAYFEYAGCDKWHTECHNCPQKKEYPKSILVDNSKWNYRKKKELFRSLDNMTIITPSIWLSDLVKKSFFDKFKVKIINNGIDLSVFKPTKGTFRRKYNLKDKFIILGVASVWDRRKGYEHFIELSNRLSQDECIVLVGLTKKQLNGLPSNIIGITRTSNMKELAEIYSEADVFVNPTLEEVMGLVNVESLACGTPVITFDTGGSIECIDNSCGVVVQKGDITSLKCEIDKLKLNNILSDKCISRSKLYNKDDKFKGYVDIYLGALI